MSFKPTIYLLAFLSLCAGCGLTEDDNPSPEDVFVKFYGRGSNEAVDLQRTSTGDVIILAKNQLEDGDADFYLVKVDEAGNEVDSRILDGSDGSEDQPKKIKAVGNDEFLIVGQMSTETGIHGIWARINVNLEVVSSAESGSEFFNVIDSVEAVDIIATTEDDGIAKYVIIGHSRKIYSSDIIRNGNYQIILTKEDDEDSTYWVKSHGFSGNEFGLALFETPQRGILAVGEASEGSNRGVYVFETNRYGTNDQGGDVYNASSATSGEGASPSADDIPLGVAETSLGYSIVGSTLDQNGRQVGFHIAVNASGQQLENKTFILQNDYNLACQAIDVAETAYGELMVTGSIPVFAPTGDGAGVNKLEQVFVSRLHRLSGRIVGGDQNYGTTVGNDRGNAVLALPGGDVLVATTIDFGSGTKMVGLLRLNRYGELKD
ncbi:hypothetical protein [Marinoscillum furvescens]|uniref:FG-GAP repeat protein n=1 Tax=Marinoscillum furvescens DSM 4134 TaxID=1122208 RepID=A0A3D9L6Z7_MARFU|nr:hypothetical protein [Marinoscillum furvescens]REE02118.1 hypothetical protein C7460_102140 [Marinoscillum furvescens DSM 4134]